MNESPHIVEAVLGHAAERPDAPFVTLVFARGPTQHRTWQQLADGARRCAAALSARGVCRGDIVVLVGTHHVDAPACWLGAVWLGAVPTFLAEPQVRIDRDVYWARLAALLERLDAKALLRDPKVTLDASWPTARFSDTYDAMVAPAASTTVEPVHADDADLLLLQHSSGTTGLHKGVMLSHGAVGRHARSYRRRLGLTADSRCASWLPLYHDMGFIACLVTPMLLGVPVVWLSPFEWVANPASLMRAISQYRCTHTWLPNFAFALLANRTRTEPGDLELSCLRAVINCSEPVTAEAMQKFTDRFAADGLPPQAVQACYAMAENVFAVTSTNVGVSPAMRRVDRTQFSDAHVAATSTDEKAVLHVSNGLPIDEVQVEVASLGGSARLPVLHAGRLLIRSPFLLDGYFRRDDLNQTLLESDGFYDTGDLGYLDEQGEVFVTGRSKDLMIVGGRNIYPTDLESSAAEVSGVHPGRVVAFGVPHRELDTEKLVVLLESDAPETEWVELQRSVRLRIVGQLDIDVADVRVVARGQLRKSTSGKLARGANREWYLSGTFGAIS